MEFDKLNAFLATAIGGLIFKWLAGGVSSFWSWLNKTSPEEEFLVSTIGIKKPIIRLSLCKYKLSTKPHIKRDKIAYSTFGTIIVVIFAIGFYHFTNLIDKNPIYWIDFTYKETKDSFWIKPEEAKNRPNTATWDITPDTCNDKKQLDKIKPIKPETKKFICDYMLDPLKKDELLKETNKNSLALMVVIPIAYLSLLCFFMLGVAMFIDLYINKKITNFNKLEIAKSYQYLT
nr:DUF6216 family protein [Raoultella terrigena]